MIPTIERIKVMGKQFELGDKAYAVKKYEYLQSDFPNIIECEIIGKRLSVKDTIEYECFVASGEFFNNAEFNTDELFDSQEKAIKKIEEEFQSWVITIHKKIDDKKVELEIK